MSGGFADGWSSVLDPFVLGQVSAVIAVSCVLAVVVVVMVALLAKWIGLICER